MTNKPELKPCPFCGNAKIRLVFRDLPLHPIHNERELQISKALSGSQILANFHHSNDELKTRGEG